MNYILYSLLGLLNDLNPFNDLKKAAKAAEKAFISQLEGALLWLYANFAQDVVSLISAFLTAIMVMADDFVDALVYAVSFLGPFSLPFFLILVAFLFATLLIVISFSKNLPVVGDLL